MSRSKAFAELASQDVSKTEFDQLDKSGPGFGSIVLTPGSAPTATEGAVYYDSTSDSLKVHNGTAWADVSPAAGISHAQQWIVSTAWTSPAGTEVMDDWVKDPNDSATGTLNRSPGVLGSDMTHANGIFTFPAEGMWWIDFHVTLVGGHRDDKTIEANIDVSIDNGSNFYSASRGSMYYKGTLTGTTVTTSTNYILDVKDISGGVDTHKVRFQTYTVGAGLVGSGVGSEPNLTKCMFIRLGDT